MNSEPADIQRVWGLIRKHVPEVTSGIIKVLGIVREPGKRSAFAVASNDPRIDPVGTCVGLRGSRVKEIVAALGGREMVDIFRWDESAERFIANLLAPLRVTGATFDDVAREANVRAVRPSGLASPELALRSKLLVELTGWKLHVEVKDEG